MKEKYLELMENYKSSVGRTLKEVRESNSMTTLAFAKFCGVSSATVKDLELSRRGETLNMKVILGAAILGKRSLGSIFDAQDSENKELNSVLKEEDLMLNALGLVSEEDKVDYEFSIIEKALRTGKGSDEIKQKLKSRYEKLIKSKLGI